ncbi:unnamed protein product [Rotaria socialis]|uniref:Glucosidase 2 subunit beta n=1 Tax=Rotaria socialis TaxID=392032 RepID=A0A817NZP7_9BILA|nr:unnamed protein product [Rotaria socialis]
MMLLSSYITSVLIITVFATISSGNIEHTVLRGVPSSLQSKYAQLKSFACLDGSSTIPFEYVNDDYCDCRDGSDEPGTSACPNGRFFCENEGYIGTSIPSHLVGDGICDCCDGSDEYETSVVCNNTCFELAQKSRAEHEARRILHEVGVAKKKDIMVKSIVAVSARKARLLELEQELQTIDNELKEKEALKQLAEAPESEAKEKHQKLWEEQRAIREAIAHDNQMREMFADIDTNNDSLVSIEELQKHTELDTDQENEFTVEEVRSILGADSVNLDEFNVTVFEQISNSYQKLPQPSTEAATHLEEVTEKIDEALKQEEEKKTTTTSGTEGYYEEDTNHHHDDDSDHHHHDEDADHHHHEETITTVATSLDHGKHIHDDTVPQYDDETKKLMEIADHARNEYNEVERKVHDVKRQIEDLRKQADVDVGSHGEYSAFMDQCFDYDEREYTYRVCMFKDAKQISKGGGSDVTIGYWDAWTGPSDNKYLKMKYANGATCWNGPARSLTITFQCGVDHKIIDVREPTRCEYSMLFETPSACDEKIATTIIHPNHEEF